MKKAIYLLLVSVLFVTACTEQAPRIAKYTDLYAVKGTDSLFLDRYTAVSVEQDDARPCLVFVFGGGFIAGERDAERYLPFFHYMVNQGYDVVSIDYRLGLKQVVASGDLSPENMMLGMARTISMAVEDLYDATAFIVDKADEWGIDSSQIVGCGSSAGAITVLHGEYALCNASPLVQHLPAGFRYAGIVSFAGAIFEMGEELRWASQPAPMMLFHGDADANVPYNVIRESGVGFFGSKYIAGQLRAMNSPYYFYSVENASHVIATAPMDGNRDAIDAFLSKLVVDKEPLMIETDETMIGAPEVRKDFTLAEYIASNFL